MSHALTLAERRELLKGSFDHYADVDHLLVTDGDNMPFLPQDNHLAQLHATAKGYKLIEVPRVVSETAADPSKTEGGTNGGEGGTGDGDKKPDPASYDRLLTSKDRKTLATALKLPTDATDLAINTRLIELGLALELSTEDILKAVK